MSDFNRFILLASIASLTGCSSPPYHAAELAAPAGPHCFRANELYGYQAEQGGMVRIRTTGDRWFEMRLHAGCPEFSWISQIGIRPMESSWLCEGKPDLLITPHPAGLNRCPVSGIRPIASVDAPSPTGG